MEIVILIIYIIIVEVSHVIYVTLCRNHYSGTIYSADMLSVQPCTHSLWH